MDARDIVRRAVVATNPYWPLSALNRVPYRVAVAAVARRMRRLEGARSLHLRNSLTRPDWEPGVSDIDLTLVTEATPDARRDYALLCSVRDAYRGLKRAFPMLGELDVLTSATVGAWSRLGVAGHETKSWQTVFGEGTDRLGDRPGEQRFRLDACDHARYFCLGPLQQRFFAGAGVSPLSARELRRIAAKVLAYAALARGEARTAAVLAGGAMTPAGMAATALRSLDAAARSLDLSGLWAEPPAGSASAIDGATGDLAFAQRPEPRGAIARPAPGIDAIVDADRLRIVILRDDLGAQDTEAAFAWLARDASSGAASVKVVTPAVLAHWLRCSDPYLYTHLVRYGRVAYGRAVTLPAAPHERSYARCVLAQAPNVISAARSRDLVPPFAAEFVAGRPFALAVERALFVRTLLACGTVSPWHHELAAESRRRFGDDLARRDAIRERAVQDADGAGFAAFALLRELADDVALGIGRTNVEDLIFRRA
jgi:hypothetical protein